MLLKYPTCNIILNIEMVRNVNYEKGATDFFF